MDLICLGSGLGLLGCKIGETKVLFKVRIQISFHKCGFGVERTAISNQQLSQENPRYCAGWARRASLESARADLEYNSKKTEARDLPSTNSQDQKKKILEMS